MIEKNPLKMKRLEPDGPLVLPSLLCTDRRKEFIGRGNVYLGFYVAIAHFSDQGQKALERGEASGQLRDDTRIRATMDPGGFVIQPNYGLLKKQFASAGSQLTNQVFLMVYGNLEAYFLDILADGFRAIVNDDPEGEAIKVFMGKTWRGKLDSVSQRLGIPLGKNLFVNKFRDLEMGFLGDECTDPIDFLERMADFRHRLVHSAGRADQALIDRYPNAGLELGQMMQLPFGLPQGIHLFLIKFTEVLDERFSTKFKWQREWVAPEKLVA